MVDCKPSWGRTCVCPGSGLHATGGTHRSALTITLLKHSSSSMAPGMKRLDTGRSSLIAGEGFFCLVHSPRMNILSYGLTFEGYKYHEDVNHWAVIRYTGADRFIGLRSDERACG